MHLFARTVTNTPLWVFPLFVYLVWQGVQSLHLRTVPFWRVLIVPIMFILFGLSGIVQGHENGFWPVLAWLAAAVLLVPLAFLTSPRLLSVDRRNRRVTRPGSVIPLIRNTTVFILHYGIGVAAVLRRDGYRELALVGHVVSGATAGYFMGWLVIFLRHYRTAKDSTEVI